jgi:TonB family protein
MLNRASTDDEERIILEIDRAPPADKVALTNALGLLQFKLGELRHAADTYRHVYESEEAAPSVRIAARADLAAVLLRIDRNEEIAALYEDEKGQLCPNAKSDELFVLASAYNATRNYSKAEELFKLGMELEKSRSKIDLRSFGEWPMLGVYIACNQKQWALCGERFNGVLHQEVRGKDTTPQLTAVLARLRRVPELATLLDRAETDALITGRQVLPSKSELQDLVPLNLIGPIYPTEARHKWIEGYVAMLLAVDESGIPTSIKVIDSWPAKVFDVAGVTAAKQWLYKPRTIDGKAVPTTGIRTIEFRLEGTH